MLGRILAALVAAWLITAALIGLCLAVFPKSAMDALAAVAVGIGVITAVFVWRATKRWAPRKATEFELQQGFDVHLGPNLLAVMFLVGVPSFGIFALLFWYLARSMPRRVDPLGMTLRDDRRIAWNDVVSVREVRVRKAGIPIGRRWEVSSASVTGNVVPVYLREGKAVLEFLSRVLDNRTIA